ncbi:hypothetical protein MLD38_006801 [Melastoma candidum]|uniref:Uncharacterized protein n=1 Tax=Melastoma candidum TaxID=119954 RepID=A0ACB9RQD4_9MYRT|nr:hypothetical protein MLD38_006801 [Melastoma candidum]
MYPRLRLPHPPNSLPHHHRRPALLVAVADQSFLVAVADQLLLLSATIIVVDQSSSSPSLTSHHPAATVGLPPTFTSTFSPMTSGVSSLQSQPQPFSVNIKSKPSIIGFPKTQKTALAEAEEHEALR